jgi:cardiolipin synthase
MGLTMLRLILLPVFLWIMLEGAERSAGGHDQRRYRWAAVGVFAMMAMTDKLDGYLARKLHQTSRLGTLLDPLADKLLVACSIILLSFSWVAPAGYSIPKLVVILIYGKDVVVAGAALTVLYFAGRVYVAPRMLGKASTFFQLTLIMATLLAPDLGAAAPRTSRAIVATLWWLVSAVAVAACADYIATGVKQFWPDADAAMESGAVRIGRD